MRKPHVPTVAILAFLLAVPTSLFADYTYQQTTQLTGGTLLNTIKALGAFSSQARKAGDPVISTVYLKDNRMATVNPDSIEIIDLDKETITHVDLLKKTYTVITFEQMKQQLADAEKQMAKSQPKQPAAPPPSNPDDVKISFDVHVRNTDTVRPVSGLDAKEAIMTMVMNATDKTTQQSGAMAITNDMWMVPEIPGYTQINEFHMRMAKKMSVMTAGVGLDLTKLLAQNPGATDALVSMGKEMQKVKGVPVMQIMRMGATTDGKPLPAASEAPLPPSNTPAMPSGGDIAKQSAASMLTSHIPFGFGKKKQQDPPPPDPNANQNAPTPTSSILMETQITTSNFSTAPVDTTHFDVPAGFKQLQSPAEKH